MSTKLNLTVPAVYSLSVGPATALVLKLTLTVVSALITTFAFSLSSSPVPACSAVEGSTVHLSTQKPAFAVAIKVSNFPCSTSVIGLIFMMFPFSSTAFSEPLPPETSKLTEYLLTCQLAL